MSSIVSESVPLVAEILSVIRVFQLQFGSECRDQILESMMQFEKSDALGPLDEDDSDAEDEEVDDEHDESVDEETEGEESDGEYGASNDEGDESYYSSRNATNVSETFQTPTLNNFSLNNLNDSNSVAFVGEESRPNTVETFCNTTVPTVAMFNALEENDKVLAFKTFLHVRLNCNLFLFQH